MSLATGVSSLWTQTIFPVGGQGGALAGLTASVQQQASGQRAAFADQMNALSVASTDPYAPAAPAIAEAVSSATLAPASAGAVAAAVPASAAPANPLSALSGFYTQTIAQTGPSSSASAASAAGASAQQKFLSFAKETPTQRLRDQILNQMGMTEQQVAGMDPAEQAKVEATIKEKIQEQLQKQRGGIAVKDPSTLVTAQTAPAADTCV